MVRRWTGPRFFLKCQSPWKWNWKRLSFLPFIFSFEQWLCLEYVCLIMARPLHNQKHCIRAALHCIFPLCIFLQSSNHKTFYSDLSFFQGFFLASQNLRRLGMQVYPYLCGRKFHQGVVVCCIKIHHYRPGKSYFQTCIDTVWNSSNLHTGNS